MHFSDQFLDEVVARNDIADVVSGYVTLTRKGGNLFGLCPFHNEKTPSFSVAPDKQIYHCFGCKKGGGVINFIMEIEGLSFPEAVEFLAKRANIPLPAEDEARSNADRLRRRVLELNRAAARWYYDQLQLPQGAAVQAYLDKRQIRRGIAVRFGMGASLDQWDALLRAMTDKGFTKQELLASGLVFAAELINSALETLVDVMTGEYREFARSAKDMAAGAVLVAIPISVLFMFMQRYYVSGITGGAVKG